eukprot:TRINITY_DN12752_c0_g1_i1.p1 TRINITY_DN12752_c0_g1~~TRINITY_DN12752_c0_g1_i1.p1  ORF type:complete len:569 (+),score=31.88 TRINITY_DN12752_c0_g1_i1:71-1777(+)
MGARLAICSAVVSLIAPCPFGDFQSVASSAASNNDPLQSAQAGRPQFVSEAAQYCYRQLLQDSNCCLDIVIAPTVSRTQIRRDGTAWSCSDAAGCDDANYGGAGSRGVDVLWTPRGADCNTPRALYIHGGSWMYGAPDRDGYASFISKLAERSGIMILVIDYRLVPVGTYSQILHASLEALNWLSENGPSGNSCKGHAIPPLLVGGDSSGGGSALSLALHLQTEPTSGPKLSGIFVYSPWTNLMCDTPTYYSNAFAKSHDASGEIDVGDIIDTAHPARNVRDYRANARTYVNGNESLLQDPIASPMFADSSHWKQAPPMYISVSGTECLTGDSVIVAYKAASAGTAVFLDIYPGMWHVFPMYSEGCGGATELWQGIESQRHTADFIKSVTHGPLANNVRSGMSGKQFDIRTRLPYVMIHYDSTSADRWIPDIPFIPREAAEASVQGEGVIGQVRQHEEATSYMRRKSDKPQESEKLGNVVVDSGFCSQLKGEMGWRRWSHLLAGLCVIQSCLLTWTAVPAVRQFGNHLVNAFRTHCGADSHVGRRSKKDQQMKPLPPDQRNLYGSFRA